MPADNSGNLIKSNEQDEIDKRFEKTYACAEPKICPGIKSDPVNICIQYVGYWPHSRVFHVENLIKTSVHHSTYR